MTTTPTASPDDLEASTLPSASTRERGDAAPTAPMTALVVLWSRADPTRVGEVLLIPREEPRSWIFGRGEGRGDEGRLSLVQQWPGYVAPTGPLTCPRISRAQLRLTPSSNGGVLVENLGVCPMVHAGRDAIHTGRDVIHGGRDAIHTGRDAIHAGREVLHSGRDTIHPERDAVHVGRDSIHGRRDAIHSGREVSRAEVAPGDTLLLRNELLLLCVLRAPMPPLVTDDSPVALHRFGEADPFGLVGESAAMWSLRQQIYFAARNPYHVLVLGESGTGKELVAQAIHMLSSRRGRPIVARNAVTIPEGLADAELFGNIRNYPNPGMPERPGLVGEAHQSTLFLDEFAELPRAIQAHLLRVLDNGEYQRLGDATMRRADLRLLAATNRPESDLKHDMLARLKLRIAVPDLNARREDIPLLVVHLLRRHASADPVVARRFFAGGDLEGLPVVSPGLMEALVRHHYTTHVRELDGLLVRASMEGVGRYLELSPSAKRNLEKTSPSSPPPEDLERFGSNERARLMLLRQHRFSPTACGRDPAYRGNRQTADLHLRQILCQALQLSDWDINRAARLLAGSDAIEDLDRSRGRLLTFLSNLRARLADQPEDDLRRALLREWKGSELVFGVLEALRDGRIKTE